MQDIVHEIYKLQNAKMRQTIEFSYLMTVANLESNQLKIINIKEQINRKIGLGAENLGIALFVNVVKNL